ncbi:sensor histidine kinase [Aestuariibacter salexigens]|uniref:sensor histidine kinase n=1 Tax=Aestuariibacter salexigens TaxID=226010 RepID=UPI00040C8152|nr:histidine kinase [Aestuariibacter salexigens]
MTEYFPKRFFWATNILFWLAALTVVSYMQSRVASEVGSEYQWSRLWTMMSPWFLNYIWISGVVFALSAYHFRQRIKTSVQILNHVVAMVLLLLAYWIVSLLMQYVIRGTPIGEYPAHLVQVIRGTSIIDLLMYMGIVAMSLAVSYYHKSVDERIQLRRLQSELVHEQLKSLRSQLNPHFLFNALNTIASLVRLKREKEAVTALSELSLMLRKTLESKNAEDIKLKDEISFINSYLALQKMRFADKLNTRISIDEDCLDVEIPNMLLHPLVENAVQHGSQLESNMNRLDLEVTRHFDELRIKLTNQVAVNDQHEGYGIGLNNTRERLARLYRHFTLELRPLNGGLFETLLALPIGERHVKSFDR